MPTNPLLAYKNNVYSQFGEDGIIEYVLRQLPDTNKWCVEFGAWDGIFLSNTCNLVRNFDYNAVFIEGNNTKYNDLCKNYANNPKVHPFKGLVGWDENSLDQILNQLNCGIPDNFDFLSLDVDGNEYHIWDAMAQYRPKLVCLEFNPTIHPDIDFVQQKSMGRPFSAGASISALVRLGKSKEYELIATTENNAFFIEQSLYHIFNLKDNSPSSMMSERNYVTYYFTGYDGQVYLRGYQKLPWHNTFKILESRTQVLPAFLREHPSCYGTFKPILLRFYRSFYKRFLGLIKRKW